MRVWRSPDRVWRLEYRPNRAEPYRLEWRGGWVKAGRSMQEITDFLAEWVVERGEEIPDLQED